MSNNVRVFFQRKTKGRLAGQEDGHMNMPYFTDPHLTHTGWKRGEGKLTTECIPTWLGVFLQQRLQLLFLLAVKLALHGQQHVLVQQHPYQVKRACSNQTAFRRTCLRMQRKGSRGTGYLHNPEGCCCLLFVGCLTSQRHASVSQGRICSDNFFVLPHWERSCRSNFPSHPVTVYWHRADQSQRWPYNARRLAG